MSRMELLDTLKEGWLVVAGFAGGLVAWGRTTTKVSHLEETKKVHDERIKACEQAVQSIEISAAATEAHIQNISKSLDILVEEVRRLRPH